jgi:3,4-dihydroxy-2-butanone 4-phosphate synthase
MALTSAQRSRLPNSAFAYPSQRKYPVPTKAQARRAGISERQRLATHRNALSRAAQRKTMGTPTRVRSVVARRHGGGVKSVSRRGR